MEYLINNKAYLFIYSLSTRYIYISNITQHGGAALRTLIYLTHHERRMAIMNMPAKPAKDTTLFISLEVLDDTYKLQRRWAAVLHCHHHHHHHHLPHDKYHVEIPKYHEIFHLLAYVISSTQATT